MRIIYKGNPAYQVDDNLNICRIQYVSIHGLPVGRTVEVDYGDPDLIIDPTDYEWEGALNERWET